jgi:hypothetical protein
MVHLTRIGLITWTDDAGTFDLSLPLNRASNLEVRAVCYHPTRFRGVVSGEVEVVLRRDPDQCVGDLSIVGRLRDPGDRPDPIGGATMVDRDLRHLDVSIVSEGRFRIRVPYKGTYRFKLYAYCYKPRLIEVEVGESGVDLGDVVLEPSSEPLLTGDGKIPCPLRQPDRVAVPHDR